jgi:hypothetical protein
VLFRPMFLPIALFPSPQLCVLPNSPISRFSQKNRVVSKHSGGGRAQSPLHPARDSECFSTATSPRCVCVKRGSPLWDFDTRQERGELIFVVKGGGEKARSRDEESKKVGLRQVSLDYGVHATVSRRGRASLIYRAKMQNDEKSKAERSKHWQRAEHKIIGGNGKDCLRFRHRGPDRPQTAKTAVVCADSAVVFSCSILTLFASAPFEITGFSP